MEELDVLDVLLERELQLMRTEAYPRPCLYPEMHANIQSRAGRSSLHRIDCQPPPSSPHLNLYCIHIAGAVAVAGYSLLWQDG
jgi:hypothetical protein